MSRAYPQLPIIGVGAVIIEGGKILLIKRGNEPGAGQWTLPGGVVELGESLEDAVRREVSEECGIKVEIEYLAGIVERVIRDDDGRIKYHYIITDYTARYTKGRLVAGSDVTDIGWFSLDKLDKYHLTEGLIEFLKKLDL
jgi:8-oxo-dGTP diphosphatase